MIDVYKGLKNFPQPDEQPKYYGMFQNIGKLSENPNTRVLVADTPESGLNDV